VRKERKGKSFFEILFDDFDGFEEFGERFMDFDTFSLRIILFTGKNTYNSILKPQIAQNNSFLKNLSIQNHIYFNIYNFISTNF
jgi:hypothetical protein